MCGIEPDLNVPAGDAGLLDEQPERLWFSHVVELVDDLADLSGEVGDSAPELVSGGPVRYVRWRGWRVWSTGVERHSLCTWLVTRGEDELWITSFDVIGQARRQHDEDGAFCHADRPRLCDGKPTRTAGAQAPRSGSGAAALPKPTTGPGASDWQASDTMPMKPSRRGWRRSSSAVTYSPAAASSCSKRKSGNNG
jgi:hypothetical protein